MAREKELRRSLAVFPIGTVMKLTDLTARQIRYYEDQGLMQMFDVFCMMNSSSKAVLRPRHNNLVTCVSNYALNFYFLVFYKGDPYYGNHSS